MSSNSIVWSLSEGNALNASSLAFVRQTFQVDPSHPVIVCNCDVESEGIWSGIKQLAKHVMAGLDGQPNPGPYEKNLIFYYIFSDNPEIRPATLNLTDMTRGEEHVRNFAVDRAYRIVSGLVELYEQYCVLQGQTPILMLLNLDKSSKMTHRFVQELIRRRGKKLNQRLWFTASRQLFDLLGEWETLGFPSWQAQPPHGFLENQDPFAELPSLQERIAFLNTKLHDPTSAFNAIPELIALYKATNDSENLLKTRASAIGLCNHFGFYEDAAYYLKDLLPQFEVLHTDDETFWNYVGNAVNALIGAGQAQDAYALLTKYEPLFHEPGLRSKCCYTLSMFHARYLKERNYPLAEALINEAVEKVHRSAYPAARRTFFEVFYKNGLALIYFNQGRVEESVALCVEGFDILKEHLTEDQHLLHRSVLLYNCSQVYTRVGQNELALKFLDQAIPIDPNYPEYYNDKGNLLQKTDQFEEALACYLKSCSLSAPYPEVYFNMGICYAELGRFTEALNAFERALDLNPAKYQAYMHQADIYDSLGEVDKALDLYRRYLENENNPDARANVAVLLFNKGDFAGALDQINWAIQTRPDTAQYYQNRAALYDEMGLLHEANQDRKRYLQLNPDAEDKDQVLEELAKAQLV